LILTLDLATTVGFCFGKGDVLPTVGHVVLPGVEMGDQGPKFSAFRRWMLNKIAMVQPSLVVYEAPILPKPQLRRDARGKSFIFWPTNIATTTVLQGLAAVVQLECEDLGIECRSAQVSEIKKELAGFGRADKADMMAAAERCGLRIAVHDEADAFGIWLLAVRFWAKEYQRRWDTALYGMRGAML
jgi:hypothetical protein